MRPDFDAIVIGGGPAGAFAALKLARAKARVLLVDRRAPGEGKCCGHCLNPRALPLLREAGLFARVKAVAQGETRRLILRTPAPFEGSFDLVPADHEPGLLLPRESFDGLILRAAEAAGVEVFRRASATVWRGDANGAVVEIREREAGRAAARRRCQTRLVIGADGLRSGVARSTGLASSRPRARSARGLSFDLQLSDAELRASRDALDFNFPAGAIAMHLTPLGYVGVARSGPRRLHVGALIRPSAPNSPKANNGVCSDVASILGSFPQVWAALEPVFSRASPERIHAIAPMPWRATRIANATTALVGDAAGYAEPFTGEGLSWALEGAAVLTRAATVTGSFAWGCAAAQRYEHEWRVTIERRVRRCALIARLLRSRAAMLWAPAFLSLAPVMVRALVRQIGAEPMELAS